MGPKGKVRSPLAVILLGIITLGIYTLYWWYASFKEMKEHSGQGIGGALGLLIGFFFFIVNLFIMPSEVKGLYERAGRESPISAATGCWILLPLIGLFVWFFKVQGALNRYWEDLAGPAPAAAGATAI